MTDLAKEFWDRFDKLLGNMKLKVLSRETGIGYTGLHSARERGNIPGPEALVKLAAYWKVSIDFLLTGTNAQQIKSFGGIPVFESSPAYKAAEIIVNLSSDKQEMALSYLLFLKGGDNNEEKKDISVA